MWNIFIVVSVEQPHYTALAKSIPVSEPVIVKWFHSGATLIMILPFWVPVLVSVYKNKYSVDKLLEDEEEKTE